MEINYKDDVIMPEGYTEEMDIFSMADTEEGPTKDLEAPLEEVFRQTDETVQARDENQSETNEGSENTEEQSEPTEQENASEEQQDETLVQPRTLKVKFNHVEQEIPEDEAVLLAQKGMNYDKVAAKAQEAEAQIASFEKLAKELGFESAEDMKASVREKNFNQRVQELIDQGNTEAMAKYLVEQQIKRAAETAPAPTAPTTDDAPAIQQTQPKQDKYVKEAQEYEALFPAVPVKDLPKEVWDLRAAKGISIAAAYAKYQLDQANNTAKVLKQNQAAAQKAPVSGVSKGAPVTGQQEVKDPFIEGFESV